MDNEWAPHTQIKLPPSPFINVWLQDLIDKADTYPKNVKLFHHLMDVFDTTENRVRKHAFKSAAMKVYKRMTGKCWSDNNISL